MKRGTRRGRGLRLAALLKPRLSPLRENPWDRAALLLDPPRGGRYLPRPERGPERLTLPVSREERSSMSANALTTGRVTQVLGPVVDVEFPPGALPEVFTALKITNAGISSEADNLTVEV